MGELGALFNPGMRHELEERQAKAARREEEGNARDGDLRIDLESGVAVINIPGADDGRADLTRRSRPRRRRGPPTSAATAAPTTEAAARRSAATGSPPRHALPTPTMQRRSAPRRCCGPGASAAARPTQAVRQPGWPAASARCHLAPVSRASARQQPTTWSSTMPVACISA